ncbi:MAG: UMP kinase [Erysipelotrichaceae bacterium]|nr:UMP kinase [Erysipelotrichaceae bacterium]
MYKRILLKLSGEALGSKENVFDIDVMSALGAQIRKIVEEGCEVGIVVGGGNLVRGKQFEKIGLDRVASDHIGMLGTTLNAMVLAAALEKNGVSAKVMSATQVDGVEGIDVEKARKLLKEKTVVIFGGGVGEPYFSTDTGSALRASEIKAEVIFMAKNGVDGVYDSDPDSNPNAKRFEELSFDDILKLNLKVIDQTAASLCKDNGIDAFVFNMSEEDNIYKAVTGKAVGTVIHSGK